MTPEIQIISAASVLGLKPGGVERLPQSLLNAGLSKITNASQSMITVPTLNEHYSHLRNNDTNCLNPGLIIAFSLALSKEIENQLNQNKFSMVLGGDCSILLGILPALKQRGRYGLVFMDAHADYYLPEESTTGEVADMDLAIVTGKGPAILCNIQGGAPYIKASDVIHIGQRDAEEAENYGAQAIDQTEINCYDLDLINKEGAEKVCDEIASLMNSKNTDGFWLHFDTDVLSDNENPAVDYRLFGGLTFDQTEYILRKLIETKKIVGMSVTIFNPDLDHSGEIARKIVSFLQRVFN